MRGTPLESWLRGKMLPPGDEALTRQDIAAHQLHKLREVVSYVTRLSPFYRNLFSGVDGQEIKNLGAFTRLPFTTSDDIRANGMKMLCTPPDQIERIVTLQSSGTTGEPKRLFFTAQDLELTVDFFQHGMATMVEPGGTVIIFLPGERPDSVGDLLARGLARLGVKAVPWGLVQDIPAARAEILRHDSPCLVGIPTQILALARDAVGEKFPTGRVGSVLLSADYVPTAIQRELERAWGCRVFTHYGLTETGLGGGVECEAGAGYHLREADLYTEIVHPVTGEPVPDGISGEVVFTTLTRRGMPLVRYRTGDLARLIPEPCPCGTVLRRLGRVKGRLTEAIQLQGGLCISMPILDETLFPIAGVLNFTAEVTESCGLDQLHLCIQACAGEEERVAREALAALYRAEPVAALFQQRALTVGSITFNREGWLTTGTGKRQIKDSRDRRVAH